MRCLLHVTSPFVKFIDSKDFSQLKESKTIQFFLDLIDNQLESFELNYELLITRFKIFHWLQSFFDDLENVTKEISQSLRKRGISR